MPEVIDVEKVRTREAGKQTFVELTVDIDRNLSVETGYSIGKRVEEMIKERIDDVDVTLQVKPVPKETEDIVERIRSIGAQAGCNLHHITLHKVGGEPARGPRPGGGGRREALRGARALRHAGSADKGGQPGDQARSTRTSTGGRRLRRRTCRSGATRR